MTHRSTRNPSGGLLICVAAMPCVAQPSVGFTRCCLASRGQREILSVVRKAVEETLTEHQRRIFLAAVAEEIPIDVIAERIGSTRGAVYKVVYDARRKLRAALETVGLRETD